MKLDITKNKIKTAAKKLMNENNSPKEVTSRAIAKEAGVQLAMINYCFDSREKLLFTIFEEMSLENFKSNKQLSEILQSNLAPKEKLRHIHYTICELILSEFMYTQAITGYILLNRDLTRPLGSLPLVIEHYGERKTLQECKIISYELSSIMQLVLYRHESLKDFCGYDFSDKNQLHKFIDMQIDLLLID